MRNPANGLVRTEDLTSLRVIHTIAPYSSGSKLTDWLRYSGVAAEGRCGPAS